MYKKLKHNSSNLSLQSKYKSYNVCLKKLVNVAKQQYLFSKLSSASNNPKETWKIINSALNKGTTEQTVSAFSTDQGIITDKQEISNTLNAYFSTITTKMQIFHAQIYPLAHQT